MAAVKASGSDRVRLVILGILLCASAVAAQEPVFYVKATRQDHQPENCTTANMHITVPGDWFLALPSREGLANRNSWGKRASVTYGQRSIIAPVWDVGPWNTRDAYWKEDQDDRNRVIREHLHSWWWNARDECVRHEHPRGWPDEKPTG